MVRKGARVVSVVIAMLALLVLSAGLVAQWNRAAAPAWANLLAPWMEAQAPSDSIGPVRYRRVGVVGGPPPVLLVQNMGTFTTPPGLRVRVALTGRMVFAYIQEPRTTLTVVRAPAWTLWAPGLTVCLFAVLAIWRVGRWRAVGVCVSCGYDIRGIEAGKPCPECGAAARPADV